MRQANLDPTTLFVSLPSSPDVAEALTDLVEALEGRALLDLALNTLRHVEKRAGNPRQAEANGGCVLAAWLALGRIVSGMVSSVESEHPMPDEEEEEVLAELIRLRREKDAARKRASRARTRKANGNGWQ